MPARSRGRGAGAGITPEDPGRFAGLRELTVAVPATDAFRRACGGVLHCDGTTRVQAVHRRDSPELWSILDRFRNATGLPALLNTSLNRHGQPIVRTLEDALLCVSASNLPFLIAGSSHLVCHERHWDEVTRTSR